MKLVTFDAGRVGRLEGDGEGDGREGGRVTS